jgi:hypothetical protein
VVTQASSTRFSARVGPRASFVLEGAEDDDLAMPAVLESGPNAVQVVLRRSCSRTVATGRRRGMFRGVGQWTAKGGESDAGDDDPSKPTAKRSMARAAGSTTTPAPTFGEW